MRPVARTRGSRRAAPNGVRSTLGLGRRLPWWLQKVRPPRRSRLLLAEMHAFAGCSRSQLARIARWGDVAEAGPGDVLVREDHTDFWFFVILAGSVRVTRQGREVATLRRGDHFGEVAIIGFGPQPATVTAMEPTLLFVLGRRYLLSLAATDTSVQRALFPSVAASEYRAFVREMHQQGLRYWERLAPREVKTREDVEEAVKASRPRRPGRTLSWTEALDLLARPDLGGLPPVEAPLEAPVTTRHFRLVLAAVLATVLVTVSFLYHPPIAVVTSGRVIDVVPDISITGVPVARPTGRYLLTTVNVHRPTLIGMVVARARGQLAVRAGSPDARQIDSETARRLAHDAFLDSHRLAIELAEGLLGVDAAQASIAVRDRGVTGPSAGLLYALAIADMLAPDDLAAGRVIAATGKLQSDGAVSAVAFVPLKADAAHRAGAVLFLVPTGQGADAGRDGVAVREVANVEEALRALRETR